MVSRASLVVAVSTVAMLLSACTPTASPSPSGTPVSAPPTVASASPTPTPTHTWSAVEQAAIAAVDAYKEAARRIENDPAAFTEKQMKAILTKVAGSEVVKANVGSYLELKKRGFRYSGASVPVMTVSHGATDVGYATQVIVTRCNDQRGVKVLDKDGREVNEATLGYELPEFNMRQYVVQKRKGETHFRVYGLGKGSGSCGP